jgi:hypothetical protein
MLTSTPITVSHNAVGLETVGDLTLGVNWRAPTRQADAREWHESLLALPLAEIAVKPESILVWDNNPTRPNSPKRFNYMLGLRALPRMVIGGNDPDNLHELVAESDYIDLAGYPASRNQIVDLTTRFFAEHPGSIARANTRIIFRYQPPVDKAARAAIRDYLGVSTQGTLW